MTEQERELDMMVAELEQENRLLRARNERLEAEQAQKQESVGTVKDLFTQAAWERLDLRGSTKVYTAPTQRQWVGLSDDEAILLIENDSIGRGELIDLVEAKLKEKNT